MKRLLSITAVLMVLFVGCSEQMSVNSSLNTNTDQPNWIKLPKAKGNAIEQIFSVSKSISGSIGGTISLNKSYIATTGNLGFIIIMHTWFRVRHKFST